MTNINDVYRERNQLVAALSKLWPAHLALHAEDDAEWDKEWRNIVFIHAPVGQLSWHIHDSDLPMFSHLSYEENCWDGHSTEEKYRRLNSFIGEG